MHISSKSHDDRSGAIVVCAANTYDSVKVADQHMAEALSRLRPVLYVDPPISFLTAAKYGVLARALARPWPQRLSASLSHLTPVVQPYPARRGMVAITNALLRLLLRRATEQLGVRVSAVVSAWPLNPIFGSCRERVKIYWAQDDFVGGAALLGLQKEQLRVSETRVAKAADAIVAANPLVEMNWRSFGSTSHLVPYGVDAEAYGAVELCECPTDVRLAGPIAGFVGHINDRIDLSLLEGIADRGRSLLLVGPRSRTSEPSRWDAFFARPNVAWVGSKPFNQLAPYLGAIDVGLLPYGDSAFNRGSFPLKTLEYLAAGKPVVATDLPANRWLNTELITIAGNVRDFADATEFWLDQPRGPRDVVSRRTFASQHSWGVRANAMNAVIDSIERRNLVDRFA